MMRKAIRILFISIFIFMLLISNFYMVFAADDSLTPISFQYIWASEEYDQAPMFNDIVVIEYKEAGAPDSEYKNIALLPEVPEGKESNLVDINNTRNTGYHYDNVTGTDVAYLGYTPLLSCQADVKKDVTYHFRIGVLDKGDAIFDSAAFIKAHSIANKPAPEIKKNPNPSDRSGSFLLNAEISAVRLTLSTGEVLQEIILDDKRNVIDSLHKEGFLIVKNPDEDPEDEEEEETPGESGPSVEVIDPGSSEEIATLLTDPDSNVEITNVVLNTLASPKSMVLGQFSGASHITGWEDIDEGFYINCGTNEGMFSPASTFVSHSHGLDASIKIDGAYFDETILEFDAKVPSESAVDLDEEDAAPTEITTETEDTPEPEIPDELSSNEFVIVTVDDLILHGATLDVEYKIKIKSECGEPCTEYELKDIKNSGFVYRKEQKLISEEGTNEKYGWQAVKNGDDEDSEIVSTIQKRSIPPLISPLETIETKIVLSRVLSPGLEEENYIFDNEVKGSFKTARTTLNSEDVAMQVRIVPPFGVEGAFKPNNTIDIESTVTETGPIKTVTNFLKDTISAGVQYIKKLMTF